jgi:hypothetical protein
MQITVGQPAWPLPCGGPVAPKTKGSIEPQELYTTRSFTEDGGDLQCAFVDQPKRDPKVRSIARRCGEALAYDPAVVPCTICSLEGFTDSPALRRAQHVGALLLLVVPMACEPPLPSHPPFTGRPTESWFAFVIAVPDAREPRDLVLAFEASARGSGCRTDRLQASIERTTWGIFWYGVSADCTGGTIALVSLNGARVSVGCLRPTTREQCEGLLRGISEGTAGPVPSSPLRGVTSGAIVMPPSASSP